MPTNHKTKIVDRPPTFRDDKNREWTIKLNLQLLDDVLEQTGVDLAPEGNETQLTALLFSRKKLAKVLWLLCQKQAEQQGIDQRSFREGFEAEAYSKAWGATVDAVLFFIQSQSPARAKAMLEVVEAEMRVVEAGTLQMVETLKDQEIDQAMQATTRRIAADMKAGILAELEKPVTR